VPRQKTSVLGLLRWLRKKVPFFVEVLLKDFTEDDFQVQVFVVFNDTLAPSFTQAMTKRPTGEDGHVDEDRRLALLEVLADALAEGPDLVDVELTFFDYSREELGDFDPPDHPGRLPLGAFLFFKLFRKTVEKKGTVTETADDPDADAGGPGYVVRAYDLPDNFSEHADKADFDPDWLRWAPVASEEDKVAKLMKAACELIRPEWPRYEDLAAALREAGHTTLKGAKIDEDNVRRIIWNAELLLGNTKPDLP
jgi:hypothetical protein